MQLGEAIARRGIRKRYYLETRGDVLLRNKKVFKLWKRLGLNTMFLGLEAIDDEGLKRYRKRVTLFDIQHAVLPRKLPLAKFYKELVETQRVLSRKHLGWAALRQCAGIVVRHLLRGQTNFLRMIWKFNSVYRPDLQLADHGQPIKYEIDLQPPSTATVERDG